MAVTAVLLPIPATPLPALADPQDEESSPPLVVESITPEAIDEDSTLRVNGEVTNTTSEDFEDVTVRIRYSRHPFTSRDELDEFASGDGWQPNASGPKKDITDTLAPDDSQEYVLSSPVDELGLPGYGVYPLVVEAIDGDGDTIGAQYTFLPHSGEGEVPEVDIAWVWPLMDRPHRADDDTFLSEALPSSVSEQGRLGRLLTAGAQTELDFEAGDEDLVEELGLEELPSDEETEEETDEEEADGEETVDPSPTDVESVDPLPDEGDEDGNAEDETTDVEDPPERTEGVPVTWSVDPNTLDDIVRAAREDFRVLEDLDSKTADDLETYTHEADPRAQVWLREARRVLAADTVVSRPYASPDLAALLHNDMTREAEASLMIGRERTLQALNLDPDPDFAVPPGGLMDERVHELFTEEGATHFLLAEDSMPPASWLSTTPTAQSPLPSPEGDDGVALVADQGITDVLSMPSSGPGESTLALQRFAAETAMIAGESAGGDRVVVASPDPAWNPETEFAEGVLSASDTLPWLQPRKLEDIELPDADEREETRAGLTYPEYAPESELSSTYLGQIEDVNRDVRLFNSILVGDSDPFRPAILRLASVHWRDEEALAGITRSALVQSVQDRLDAVRIIPGEPVTLASRTGITGVLVANDLEDESVFVLLSVYSENSERLSVGEYTDSFEIEPGAKTTVYVPLSARINGRTVLHVSLHNAEGEPINSDESQILVNATGLGTQALLISGIGVLILVAALAPRALRVWARKQTARARAVAAQDGGNVEDAVASQKPDAEEAGAEDDRPEPEPTATEPDDTPDPGPEGAEPEDEEPRTTDTGEKTSGAHADGDDTHRETGGTNT